MFSYGYKGSCHIEEDPGQRVKQLSLTKVRWDMTHRQSDSKVCLIEVASPKAVFDFIVCILCFF